MAASAQDFQKAREEIDKVKPNISYDTFCETPIPTGEDKIACRIKAVPSVGFLVCKKPEYEGETCEEIIEKELQSILKVGEGNVTTVKVSPPLISHVKCGKDESLNCSGFLEEWVDSERGQFQQVRDHISNGTVKELIDKVKTFTKSGLPKTAEDLTNIMEYMKKNPSEDEYRQICDLQGFFLATGGFLVGDIPSVNNNITLNGTCWDGEPTTKEVIVALDDMIKAFNIKSAINASMTVTSSQFTLWIAVVFVVNSLFI